MLREISEPSSTQLNRQRNFFGPVNIQKLRITLYDNFGRIIDLNNMDWNMELIFECVYGWKLMKIKGLYNLVTWLISNLIVGGDKHPPTTPYVKGGGVGELRSLRLVTWFDLFIYLYNIN